MTSNNWGVSSNLVTDAEYPVINISDTYQSSTPWLGTNTFASQAYSTPITYNHLNEDIVGVIPYIFVANYGAPASLTNITQQQAATLFEIGTDTLNLLTGSQNDVNTNVYATGRDTGSGSRLIVLAETGVGVDTNIIQYEAQSYNSSTTPPTITAPLEFPASTVNGVPLPAGDGGFPSFSGLLTLLSAQSPGSVYITYLNQYDAATAKAAGAKELTYNGVALGTLGTYGAGTNNTGTSSQALSLGQYSFWSYVHVLYGTLTGPAHTFQQKLSTIYRNQDAPVLLGDVFVTRNSDGAPISY